MLPPPGAADARRAEPGSAAALPMEPHDGGTLYITAEHVAAAGGRSLVTGPLGRTILRVALPAVASMLLMTIFSSVDAYWVGTRIGSAGLAAVTAAIFWIWLIVSVAEMVSVGLTAVAARRHGERRPADAARTSGDALFLALALGATVAAIGLALLPTLFSLMATPHEVTALGERYLGTYLFGAPLIFGFFVVDATFRAAGDTRTPFLLLSTSVVATLVLDPVLILGLLGAPALGIRGAAIATLATRGVVFLIGLVILRRRGMLVLGAPRWDAVMSIVRVGLPTAATGVFFSLIYVVIARIATPFGTPALAALGIGHRVESWLFMIGVGVAAAVAAIVGQSLGAGDTARAERAGWVSVGFVSVIGILVFVAQSLWAEQLAGLFTSDRLVIAEGGRYLRIAAWSQLFITAEIVLEGALGGAGATFPPMITSTSLTALRIPLALLSVARWGTSGLWWTISLTAVGRAVAMMALWRAGGWKRRSV
ncbi:MAG TPA: MATE family efflux transporter [Gemmatimonadaceae bacterium]|nr:MATE family efflux transporter [Gemmatimonadaceae bacterium]